MKTTAGNSRTASNSGTALSRSIYGLLALRVGLALLAPRALSVRADTINDAAHSHAASERQCRRSRAGCLWEVEASCERQRGT
jgi:hypothetical protein